MGVTQLRGLGHTEVAAMRLASMAHGTANRLYRTLLDVTATNGILS